MKKKRQSARIIIARISDPRWRRKWDPCKEPKVFHVYPVFIVRGGMQIWLQWPEELTRKIRKHVDPLSLAVTFKDLRKRGLVR